MFRFHMSVQRLLPAKSFFTTGTFMFLLEFAISMNMFHVLL